MKREKAGLSVCLVAHNILPLLLGTETEVIGGAEVQQVVLARELVKSGVQVSFVSYDRGERETVTDDGIRIFKTYRPEDGVRYVRFFYPRLVEFWRALREADADVYYLMTEHHHAGMLAAFCLLARKGYVYGIGSDSECYRDVDFIEVPSLKNRLFFRFSLRVADRVVSQTERQRQALLDNFSRDSVVIKAFRKPRESTPKGEETTSPFVLWVGTIRKVKNPHLFLDLAESLPSIRFVMIGGPDFPGDSLYAGIAERAAGIDNVEFCGFLPAPETEDYFGRASLFVNTSSFEGFPNTFLQAWECRVPTISFVDPDGLIERHELGYRAKDPDDLRDKVERVMGDGDLRRRLGRNAYRLVCREYDNRKTVREYIDLFTAVAKARRGDG